MDPETGAGGGEWMRSSLHPRGWRQLHSPRGGAPPSFGARSQVQTPPCSTHSLGSGGIISGAPGDVNR